MAEETTQPAEQAAATDPPKRKGGLMALAKPLAFVSVIVLLEVVAASVLLPSADATREIGEQLAAAEKADEEEAEEAADGGADADGADEDAAKLGETREVSLGAFHVVAYNPESRTSLNVNFNLYGAVLAEEESDFYPLFESNEQRIKEQVIMTMRGMTIVDFTDPNLGLIKRKILEKTNRALGKPLLHEAIISEFAFVER